jgi:Uma2 family endonuclease
MALPTLSPVMTVVYPDTDGLPMAETDFQRKPLTYAVDALDIYFEKRPEVYVSGNLFIYYEENNPQAVVAPDVFVVVGTTKGDRRSYKLWEEPKGPDFVLEITSRSTRQADQETKPPKYEALGVQEYVQYDPTGDYLDPPLQGARLVAGRYTPWTATEHPDGTLVLRSAVLGLELRLQGSQLRFYDPATGQKLLSHQEAEAAYRTTEQARQQAEQARQQAEQARQQAEQARQQAEAQARQEAAWRQAAEARIAELQAQLRGRS